LDTLGNVLSVGKGSVVTMVESAGETSAEVLTLELLPVLVKQRLNKTRLEKVQRGILRLLREWIFALQEQIGTIHFI